MDKFNKMIKYYSLNRKANKGSNGFNVYVFQIIVHNGFILLRKFFAGSKIDYFDFYYIIIYYLIIDTITSALNKYQKYHICVLNKIRCLCDDITKIS